MPHEVSRFKLGLFVIIGAVLALGSIVWLGAVRYLQPGRTYVTFFNESVQGLQRDSVVKYRGVDIGRVVDIGVAPDYKLIEVRMQVNFHGEPEREMVAQLKTVGITGIVFVELDLRKHDGPDRSPKITFATEDPIIPSRPSEMTEILSVAEKVSQELKQVNFAKIGGDIEEILNAAREVVDSPDWQKALSSLSRATTRMEKLLNKADQRIGQLDTGGISRDTREVLQRAEALVASSRELVDQARLQVEEMDLPGRAGRMELTAQEVGQQTAGLLEEVSVVVQTLGRVSQELDALVREVRDNPSRLIFSQPPPPRRGGEQ